ncbi:pentatricopeptide repeat-containing protein [Tanacetum coccineum]
MDLSKVYVLFQVGSGWVWTAYSGIVVKACGRINGVKEGGMVHGLVLKFGFSLDLFVLSSLMGVKNVVSWTVMVDGLAKSGRVDEARRVFDEVPFRNVASWRCFGINGYLKAGDFMPKREREDCEPSARKSSSSRAHGSILGEELLQNVRLVIDELDRRGWLTLSEIAYAQSVLVRATLPEQETYCA